MPCNGTCRSCSADRTFDGNDRTQNIVGILRMALQGAGINDHMLMVKKASARNWFNW